MAYCSECKRECEVKRDGDSDGEGPYTRVYEWIQSKCCDADAYHDEELTDKVLPADVECPEPAWD